MIYDAQEWVMLKLEAFATLIRRAAWLYEILLFVCEREIPARNKLLCCERVSFF
jgi:hypothetical protein